MTDSLRPSNAETLMHKMPGGWFKASNAIVVDRVTVGEGSSIWFGCVLRGDIAPIRIGKYTNIQDLACVHMDPERPNSIGDYVSVAHQALCHGDQVGDNCLIGMHAVLMGGTRIGEGCIIGAGAVVTENKVIPPRSLVMGIPGRVVREVTDEEIEHNKWRAMTYFDNAIRWFERNSGVPDGPLGMGPGK
ncbi:MAG: gamma carbonic anhydrase family protein [Planctomycetes bacterium]|nr:gamma carbonic anhydrase family protein [Planctomycetota bacterium]